MRFFQAISCKSEDVLIFFWQFDFLIWESTDFYQSNSQPNVYYMPVQYSTGLYLTPKAAIGTSSIVRQLMDQYGQ